MEVQFIDRVTGAIAVCFVLKSIQADMSSDMFEYLFSKLFSVADFKSDGGYYYTNYWCFYCILNNNTVQFQIQYLLPFQSSYQLGQTLVEKWVFETV